MVFKRTFVWALGPTWIYRTPNQTHYQVERKKESLAKKNPKHSKGNHLYGKAERRCDSSILESCSWILESDQHHRFMNSVAWILNGSWSIAFLIIFRCDLGTNTMMAHLRIAFTTSHQRHLLTSPPQQSLERIRGCRKAILERPIASSDHHLNRLVFARTKFGNAIAARPLLDWALRIDKRNKTNWES